MKEKDGSVQIQLLEETMETLIGEMLSMAVLDSGCTKTVCGETWLNCYLETLSDEDKKLVHVEDSNSVFKFGDSKLIKSNKKVTIPTVIADQTVMLTTDVISNDLPLLLSKEAMKRANTQIDFASDKINILGRDVQVIFSTSGHYCIPIGRLNSSGMGSTEEIKEEVNLFCKQLGEKTVRQKQRIAEKLHRQFSHAKSDKLKVLLRDAEVMDRLDDSCSICKKYRRPKPRPVVGFPMVKTFNETVGMDLKEWSHSPKIWFLHLVDHTTRYSASCVIYTKRKEEIIKKIFQIWISIFGSAKKFLVDNGGEFDNDEFRSLCENGNIRICTTAAESPWGNGIVERHNATLGFSVQKIVDDLKCDLSLAVAWAVSAKNALHNVHGFSPNQLLFGKKTNFPAVVSNKPPAVEGKTTSEIVACNLNVMHAARQAFIKSESAEKLRRALCHQTRTYSDVKYFTGDIVYYKRSNSNAWKGPGTMIGQDGQQVLVKHAGSYVRVHRCRLLLEQVAFGQPMVDGQDEGEAIIVQQVASQTEKIWKVMKMTELKVLTQ